MKKKIDYRILLILVLAIILIGVVYWYFKPETDELQTDSILQSTTNATISEVPVETTTILSTINSTGEIASSLSENLELHATYYFSEIYFEENNYVQEGEKILKYTNGSYLIAPYDLVITKIVIPDSGNQCTSKHYITVSNTDVLTMTLQVAEEQLESVYVGQEANIQVSVYEGELYTGYVTNISNTATYSSNGSKFTVTVEFSNDGKILIGMTGNCSIILEKAENVIAVPVEAVTTTNGTSYVTVIEDGTTKKVQVETGISNDAYTEIKSGLIGTETVQVVEKTTQTMQTTMEGQMKQRGEQMQQMGTHETMPSMPNMPN